jgi:tRNA(Leu) C34 or U34 (ribose-2'-O)-methylase TrmL
MSALEAAADELAVAPRAGTKPDCYVISAALVKRHNVGMLIRNCVAFGVKEMLICGGYRNFGSQGTDRYLPVREFDRLRDAVADLKAKGVTICGIEITADAEPVTKMPFRGPTAFIPGNEGEGLTDHAKSLCDHFIYIPQMNCPGMEAGGTASLNVVVATGIVLHHFATWAGYQEQPREAGRDKFVLAVPPRHDGTRPHEQYKSVTRAASRAEALSRAWNSEDIPADGGNSSGYGVLGAVLGTEEAEFEDDEEEGRETDE